MTATQIIPSLANKRTPFHMQPLYWPSYYSECCITKATDTVSWNKSSNNNMSRNLTLLLCHISDLWYSYAYSLWHCGGLRWEPYLWEATVRFSCAVPCTTGRSSSLWRASWTNPVCCSRSVVGSSPTSFTATAPWTFQFEMCYSEYRIGVTETFFSSLHESN